ncbi:hypothetical protein HDU93_006099, partial [Gonapodya sp. JEL0774]
MAKTNRLSTTILKSIDHHHSDSLDSLDKALEQLNDALHLKSKRQPSRGRGRRNSGAEYSLEAEETGNSTFVDHGSSLRQTGATGPAWET